MFFFSESAVTQSLDTAKATWNKSKVEEIEQILSAARKQWFKEFGIFKRESSTGTMVCLMEKRVYIYIYIYSLEKLLWVSNS